MSPRIPPEYVAWGCSSSSSESEELKWVTSWRKGARFQYVYLYLYNCKLKKNFDPPGAIRIYLCGILPSLRVYVWFWTFLEFVHYKLIQEPKKSSASTQGGATKTHKDFQQCIGFFGYSHHVNFEDTQHKSPQFQESASRPYVWLAPWKYKVQTAVEIKVPLQSLQSLQSRILLPCRSLLSALSRLRPFNELQPLMSNLGKRGCGNCLHCAQQARSRASQAHFLANTSSQTLLSECVCTQKEWNECKGPFQIDLGSCHPYFGAGSSANRPICAGVSVLSHLQLYTW